MTKRLTSIAVKNARPKAERWELVDEGAAGLRLVIQPSGVKSWAVRYRFDDRPHKLTLGSCDATGEESADEPVIGGHLTLAAARRLAADARRLLALGKNPSEVYLATKREARERSTERSELTFKAAAIKYIEKYAKPKNRTWGNTARALGLRPEKDGSWSVIPRSFADRWETKPVPELTRQEIVRALDATEKWRRGRFAALRGMLRWMVKRGELERSPCDGMDAPKAGRRNRVLSNDEIRWFWLACDRLREPFGKLYQLLLVTAQRRSEVGRMPREELSFDGRDWLLPEKRTKNRRPHLVPLSRLAVRLIEAAPRTSSEYVFSTTGRTPPSGHTKMRQRLHALMLEEARKEATDPAKVKIEHWVLHDLRRTAVTGFQRLGVPLDVAAAVVNHKEGKAAGVTGIYALHDYAKEKRAALDAWARMVTTIVNAEPTKVLPMRRARSV